jgi:molecular chaperone HtpG
LHVAEDSRFSEDSKIRELQKVQIYAIPIKFWNKKDTSLPDDAAEEVKPEEIEVDNIINNPNPAWTKQPSELHRRKIIKVLPRIVSNAIGRTTFNIHLNVDYPLILPEFVFPKMSNMQMQKDKIHVLKSGFCD